MPLAPGPVPAQVSVRLSCPSRSDGQKVAELVIIDVPSRLVLATVTLTPDQHFNLLRGLEAGDVLPAELINPEWYPRAGHQLHTFARVVTGYPEDQVRLWAMRTALRLGLHRWQVSGAARGGQRVVWTVWTDDDAELARITDALESVQEPANV